jgi:UDP-2,3-diacylglucosamine hydrolase
MEHSIFFISDVHLGADTFEAEETKRHRLISFIRSLRGQTPLLYIVGDLFDFWFEYRSAILRQHYRVLYELSGLVESGTRVVYLAGNHDFWLGSFLDEQVGIETAYGPLKVDHQNKRLFICHGDGMISKDLGYRLMRKVLHNRFSIRLFQLIHPDLGVALGRRISRLSRSHGAPTDWDPRLAYRALGVSLLEEGYDVVIFGHNHCPDFQQADNKVYINLGDWVEHFTYGVLSEGKMALHWYEGDMDIRE